MTVSVDTEKRWNGK